MSARRGPICGHDVGPAWVDRGTLARIRTPTRTPRGAGEASADEQDLLGDLAQLVRDLAGILEPTPLADAANAAPSVTGRDGLGFGLSRVATVPPAGGLDQVGTLDRWAETVDQAVRAARTSPTFEAAARPLLQRLAPLVQRLPEHLPAAGGRPMLARLQLQVARFAPAPRRLNRRQAIEAALDAWFRSVDEMPLPSPGRDRGALWSKLDAKRPNQPGYAPQGDDAAVAGMDLASRLARQDGRRTLESLVETTALKRKLDLDQARLAAMLEAPVSFGEFQAKVWQRLSVRYAGMLEGRVVVYVDDDVLKQALRQGNLPVLSAELQELLRRRRAGDGVTDIVVKDIFDGTVFEI